MPAPTPARRPAAAFLVLGALLTPALGGSDPRGGPVAKWRRGSASVLSSGWCPRPPTPTPGPPARSLG